MLTSCLLSEQLPVFYVLMLAIMSSACADGGSSEEGEILLSLVAVDRRWFFRNERCLFCRQSLSSAEKNSNLFQGLEGQLKDNSGVCQP